MNSKLEAAVWTYKTGLTQLGEMVSATEREIIHGSGLALVTDNINFFTKSFLISTCAHLEMCVKEIVFTVASEIDERLVVASIPSSIIEWRHTQKKKNEAPGVPTPRLLIRMTRKEVDDLVSGNVYRTKEALTLVGVDLAADKAEWETWKELIQNMVTRRNNIVHHNDDASGLSLGDIKGYISFASDYIDFIVAKCSSSMVR